MASAIVVAYNGEEFVAEALRSIEAQDYEPMEVIVVDDGSTDGTAAIAKSFDAVRYVHQPNQGEAVARNVGMETARGTFLAFLDADDLWAPNKISTHMKCFHLHPHIGFSIAHMRVFLEPGTEWPPWLDERLKTQPVPAYQTSSVVLQKSVIAKVGGFDPGYRVCSDLDWFIRAKDAGVPHAVLPETLAYRRVHGANLSYQTEKVRAARLRALKASIERKHGEPEVSTEQRAV